MATVVRADKLVPLVALRRAVVNLTRNTRPAHARFAQIARHTRQSS